MHSISTYHPSEPKKATLDSELGGESETWYIAKGKVP